MGTTLTMPKLGLTMTEGTVVQWIVQDGEQVRKGQPLVVVMSKKITNEVEAPAPGIVRIVAKAKETRKVTEVIGFILEPGEALPEVDKVPAPPAAGSRRPNGRPPAPSAQGCRSTRRWPTPSATRKSRADRSASVALNVARAVHARTLIGR